MQLIETQTNVSWMPRPNEVRFVVEERMPPSSLTTSAFVFAFKGQQLLMTKLSERGWDLPGGHIEAGESPEVALHREVLEECACVLRDIRLFGYLQVFVHGAVPADYPYPCPESYQLLYLAQVEAAREFAATAEATDRRFFTPEAAEGLPWIRANRRLYEAALSSISARGSANEQ